MAASATPEERVRDLLEHVARALELEATIAVHDDGETLRGVLDGEDLGLVIGHHGQTIDALEHLARRLVGPESDRRVEIDAAGYRARRRIALEAQGQEAAEEAVRYGRPVALDSMTASERRVVHELLRERGDVETHSEGDEPDRHLVVAPAAD